MLSYEQNNLTVVRGKHLDENAAITAPDSATLERIKALGYLDNARSTTVRLRYFLRAQENAHLPTVSAPPPNACVIFL